MPSDRNLRPCSRGSTVSGCCWHQRARPVLQAAQRRAITELLFFASVGDVRRCERLCRVWNLDVSEAQNRHFHFRRVWASASSLSFSVVEGRLIQLSAGLSDCCGAGVQARLLRL